jgi:SAM-dependent methyltransferase
MSTPESSPEAPSQSPSGATPDVPCRFCGAALRETFVDLGASPLANSYVAPRDVDGAETFFSLKPLVCESCWLVQLPMVETPESIFGDYAYFSSYSSSWVEHARRFAEGAIERYGLDASSLVVEAASNDGYLLRHFVARGVPVLGIEPAANVARVAIEAGIPSLVRFFGADTARDLVAERGPARLFCANNVLAHTPYLNDFVAGVRAVLAPPGRRAAADPGGVATFEFPHLGRLVAENQFDTIYHEHFSYFSLTAVRRVFAAQGLEVFDVEELSTHGGSLRLHVAHAGARPAGSAVAALLERERQEGVETLAYYRAFAERVRETKRKLLAYLIDAKRAGLSIVGYGAPAKGNTLLNYCGVRQDFLDYTVDLSPHKQGRFLPGTRIPIHAPQRIFETRPDRVLLLPWNLADEITRQMAEVRSWGGRFVVAVPEVREL